MKLTYAACRLVHVKSYSMAGAFLQLPGDILSIQSLTLMNATMPRVECNSFTFQDLADGLYMVVWTLHHQITRTHYIKLHVVEPSSTTIIKYPKQKKRIQVSYARSRIGLGCADDVAVCDPQRVAQNSKQ